MTRAVRPEDAFDVAAVAAGLADLHPERAVSGGLPEVEQFTGGASNLTYLLRWASGGPPDLVLRRPPAGAKARGAHDMGREYLVQSRLAPVLPQVPTMVALCGDASVIGSEFYVMERLHGHVPRREMGVDLPPSQVRRLCTRVLDLLVALHAVDPGAVGLADLGPGEGYVARQVAGWSARWRAARTPDVRSFERTMAWLAARQPPDRRTCLVHNDFRFDNLVLDAADPTRPVGLLDWEMATLGDPLMDLGGALAYWVQADDGPAFRAFRRQPTHTPGMLTRREVVEHYTARTGLAVTDDEWAFYEVFGLFRLAVIVQQIYHRYYHRQTTNPAFRHFGMATFVLEHRCRRLAARADRSAGRG